MLRYRVKARKGELGGESLWHLLSENLDRRKIPIHCHTTAKAIIRLGDEVVGVTAEKDDKCFNIHARKAVVLATEGLSTTRNSRESSSQVIRSSPMEMLEIP